MITDKAQLKEYLGRDMAFFHALSGRDRLVCVLTGDPAWRIVKYLRFLRREELHLNRCRGPVDRVLAHWFRLRKNRLGERLGFKIPPNTLGPGVAIYHHGGLIVNEAARIGADAVFHGNNCIGNNGKTDENPVIGDGLDMGFGAAVIGPVTLGNRVRVGANAVVTASFPEDDITLAGLPAKNVRQEHP